MYIQSSTSSPPVGNYTSPWQWTTVTATGEWPMEARKEPTSTLGNESSCSTLRSSQICENTSGHINSNVTTYIPSNNDFHNHYSHYLMGRKKMTAAMVSNTTTATANSHHQYSRQLNNNNNNFISNFNEKSTTESPISSTSSMMLPLPNSAVIAQSGHPSNITASSRNHLPFLYNFNNYQDGGYYRST